MIDYPYKLPPRGKQKDAVESTWKWVNAAFLCRPGTGKTKMMLDTAGMNWLDDSIDALLVVAPEGVDRQWIVEGVPTHLSDAVPRKCFNYRSDIGIQAFDVGERMVKHHKHADGLLIVTMTFDGIQTPRGKKLAKQITSKLRTMFVDDESHRTANLRSAVHKAVKPHMRASRVRRIATGTLIKQNPYSAYGQFELMGPGLLGFASMSAFKSMYAELLPEKHWLVKNLLQKVPRDAQGKPRYVPQVEARDEEGRPMFRNLTDLRRRLLRHSVILTLEDVNGKEPVVNESSLFVELTKQQRKLYNDLVKWGVAEAPKGQLTVEGAMAQSIRLAQVVGGHAPCDDDWTATAIEGGNPKLERLLDHIDDTELDKLVIWCKFTPEIVAVVAELQVKYGPESVVQYHGRMSGTAKDEAKRAFIDQKCVRFFVGQQKAGGTGLDGLQGVGRYMVFYSNDYPYIERLQAISRLARTGGADTVQVWDLHCEGTVDDDIIRCLRSAQDVSEKVLHRAVVREV